MREKMFEKKTFDSIFARKQFNLENSSSQIQNIKIYAVVVMVLLKSKLQIYAEIVTLVS